MSGIIYIAVTDREHESVLHISSSNVSPTLAGLHMDNSTTSWQIINKTLSFNALQCSFCFTLYFSEYSDNKAFEYNPGTNL